MEHEKGFQYTIDAERDMVKFSKGILALVNLQSSRKGTVVNIQTFEGTWTVKVTSLVELDDYLEDFLGGKITHKEEATVINVDTGDLSYNLQSKINKYIDDEVEYFLTIDQM